MVGTHVTVAELLVPLYTAVTVAWNAAVTFTAIENVTLLVPVRTVTVLGTVTAGCELLRVTRTGCPGARDSVTIPVTVTTVPVGAVTLVWDSVNA